MCMHREVVNGYGVDWDRGNRDGMGCIRVVVRELLHCVGFLCWLCE